jgi:hypothetical protein
MENADDWHAWDTDDWQHVSAPYYVVISRTNHIARIEYEGYDIWKRWYVDEYLEVDQQRSHTKDGCEDALEIFISNCWVENFLKKVRKYEER